MKDSKAPAPFSTITTKLSLDLKAKRQRKRQDYFYWLSYRLRWSDNDMFGHVNNPYYLALVDSIVNQYLVDACGYTLAKPGSPGVGIVASTYCDYFDSLAYPDVVDVGMRVVKLGKTSVTYEIGLFRAGDEKVSAVGGSTHIWVERLENNEFGRPFKDGMPQDIRTGYLKLVAVDEGGTAVPGLSPVAPAAPASKKNGHSKL